MYPVSTLGFALCYLILNFCSFQFCFNFSLIYSRLRFGKPYYLKWIFQLVLEKVQQKCSKHLGRILSFYSLTLPFAWFLLSGSSVLFLNAASTNHRQKRLTKFFFCLFKDGCKDTNYFRNILQKPKKFFPLNRLSYKTNGFAFCLIHESVKA